MGFRDTADRRICDVVPVQHEQSQNRRPPSLPSIAERLIGPEAHSIVTLPAVTRRFVADTIVVGVKHIAMQPRVEDEEASKFVREAGIDVIDLGSCVLALLAAGPPKGEFWSHAEQRHGIRFSSAGSEFQRAISNELNRSLNWLGHVELRYGAIV